MNEFLTWQFLGSFAGAVAFITAATQLLKKYMAIDPKWIAGAVALVVSVALQLFFWQDFTGAGWTLAVFNYFVLLTAAIGSYEVALKKKTE